MNIEPPSCGFPPQPYPLKGHPRLREDTFGARAQVLPMRRLSGGAMLCHLQCARFANRRRIAGVRPSLPEALTRSPPVAAPTPNKRPSGIGELIFVTLTSLRGFSRLTYPTERRYFDEEQERAATLGRAVYLPYISGRERGSNAEFTPSKNQRFLDGDPKLPKFVAERRYSSVRQGKALPA